MLQAVATLDCKADTLLPSMFSQNTEAQFKVKMWLVGTKRVLMECLQKESNTQYSAVLQPQKFQLRIQIANLILILEYDIQYLKEVVRNHLFYMHVEYSMPQYSFSMQR